MGVVCAFSLVISIFAVVNVSALESTTEVTDTDENKTEVIGSEVQNIDNIQTHTTEDNSNSIIHKSLKINIRKHSSRERNVDKNAVKTKTDGINKNLVEASNSDGNNEETSYKIEGNNAIEGTVKHEYATEADMATLLDSNDSKMSEAGNRDGRKINQDLRDDQLKSVPTVEDSLNVKMFGSYSKDKSDTVKENTVNVLHERDIYKSNLKCSTKIEHLKNKVCYDASTNLDSFWFLLTKYVNANTGQFEDLDKIEKLFVLLNMFTTLNNGILLGWPVDKFIDDIAKILESPPYIRYSFNVENDLNSGSRVENEPCYSGCPTFTLCDSDSQNENECQNEYTQILRNATSIDEIEDKQNSQDETHDKIWLKPMVNGSPLTSTALSEQRYAEPEYATETEKPLVVVPLKTADTIDVVPTTSSPQSTLKGSFYIDRSLAKILASDSNLRNKNIEYNYQVSIPSLELNKKKYYTDTHPETNEHRSQIINKSTTESYIIPTFDINFAPDELQPHKISLSQVSLGTDGTENLPKLPGEVFLPSVSSVRKNEDYFPALKDQDEKDKEVGSEFKSTAETTHQPLVTYKEGYNDVEQTHGNHPASNEFINNQDKPIHYASVSNQNDVNNKPNFEDVKGNIHTLSSSYPNKFLTSDNQISVIESGGINNSQNPKYRSHINKNVNAVDIESSNTDTVMSRSYQNSNPDEKELTGKDIPIRFRQIKGFKPNIQDNDDKKSDISVNHDFLDDTKFDKNGRDDRVPYLPNIKSNNFLNPANRKTVFEIDESSYLQNVEYSDVKQFDKMDSPKTDSLKLQTYRDAENKIAPVKNIRFLSVSKQNSKDVINNKPSEEHLHDTDNTFLQNLKSNNNNLRAGSYYYTNENYPQNMYGIRDETPTTWHPQYGTIQPSEHVNKQNSLFDENLGSVTDSTDTRNLQAPLVTRQKYDSRFSNAVEKVASNSKTKSPEKNMEYAPKTYLLYQQNFHNHDTKTVHRHENQSPIDNNKNQLYRYAKSAFIESMNDHVNSKDQGKLTKPQYSDLLTIITKPTETNHAMRFDNDKDNEKVGYGKLDYNGKNNLNNYHDNYDTASRQQENMSYLLKVLQSYPNIDPKVKTNILKTYYNLLNDNQRTLLVNKPGLYSNTAFENRIDTSRNVQDFSSFETYDKIKDSNNVVKDRDSNETTLDKTEDIKRPGKLLLEVFEKIKSHLKSNNIEDKMIDEIVSKLYDDLPEIRKTDCPDAQFRQILGKVNSAVESVNQDQST